MAWIAFVFLSITGVTHGQQNSRSASSAGRDVTVLVTAHPHNEATRALSGKLQPEDFSVTENKVKQRIVSARSVGSEPTILAVLIQDDLVSRVNNELPRIREFIRGFPQGSIVMTGYLTVGSLRVTQTFTTDLSRAAESLRIVAGTSAVAPYNPYVEIRDALKLFDSQPLSRRMILLISDGLDLSQGLRSASPMLSLDLDRAIIESQRRSVAVFTCYAPTAGLTSFNHQAISYGQGSLNRIADETGGEAFFTGTDFVSFDPYLREFKELLGHQWLITYRSSNTGSGFRRIEVKTDVDVHLLHPDGYRVR
jgi:hypothetical protein